MRKIIQKFPFRTVLCFFEFPVHFKASWPSLATLISSYISSVLLKLLLIQGTLFKFVSPSNRILFCHEIIIRGCICDNILKGFKEKAYIKEMILSEKNSMVVHKFSTEVLAYNSG